jgi:biopolymer transport protein ExbB
MLISFAVSSIDIVNGAGILIYPLGLCSFAMVFIICERVYALRTNAVMPQDLVDAIIENKPYSGGKHSVLARILDFAEDHEHDEDAVKAFARLEINRMERGIPYLDIIYAAGPLFGLTGTIWGLLRVFGEINGDTGLPDPVAFTKGVSLALSATLLGLGVAIPALLGGGYLQRKVENYAVRIDSLLERINSRRSTSHMSRESGVEVAR